MTDKHQIECPACNGWGATIIKSASGLMTLRQTNDICDACNGDGWRDETEDEANDRAADAYSDMCEGEPPITMQERHQAAWKQKQELKR